MVDDPKGGQYVVNINHPDVKWYYEKLDQALTPKTEPILNSEDMRDWRLKNGAEDVCSGCAFESPLP